MTQDSDPPRRKRLWLAPAIALGLALVVLIVLLIPGVLRYPGLRDDTATLAALRDSNAALQDELARLGQIEAGGVCMWGGDLYPRSVEAAPVAPDPEQSLDLLPPRPEAVAPIPAALPEDEAAFDGGLDDLMRRGSVLVLVPRANGLANGTGFFVDRRHIVTNAHVVDGSDEAIVTNDTLPGPVRAQVVARTTLDPTAPQPQADFALLRLSRDEPEALPLTLAPAQRSQDIYASGYPGFFLNEEIEAYYMAIAQDQEAVPPEGLVTDGIVTTIQTAQRPGGPLDFIPHTANLSPGNSGGPLVDMCGAVVGINTFVAQSEQSGILTHGDFALASTSLQGFLDANGVSVRMAATPCDGADAPQ